MVIIANKILESFQIQSEGQKLDGGQDTSYKFGNIVLKPIDNPDYYNPICVLFNQLQPEHYRISRPIKANNGSYVVDGYGATTYEPGEEVDDQLELKLDVSTALHHELKQLNVLTLPWSDDPWTKAQRVLWHEDKLPLNWPKKTYNFCKEIINQLPTLDVPYQLIHSDLGGNILVHDTLLPLVIDFSPAIAPKAYADAIIICDSIAWAGASLASLALLQPFDFYKPYILYAVAFRVLTIGFNESCDYNRLLEEWEAYRQVWETIL